MAPDNSRTRRRTSVTTADGPRSFKERMAAAKTLAEAADDGYREIVRDDRLDYTGLPMLVVKWQTRDGYNDKTHARVWAEVAVDDQPEPVKIRFWDYGGRLGDQLREFERCGTRGNVAVMLDAREYNFGAGGMETGYEYFLADIPDEAPPVLEAPTDPDY
jgi:hypothetical protein